MGTPAVQPGDGVRFRRRLARDRHHPVAGAVGRLIGLGGFLTGPIVVLLVGAGLGLEFLAWSSGFGAVLTNTFSRWQARRATKNGVTPGAGA